MQPLFLDAPKPWSGLRFAVHHAASVARRGSVLFLHPLAEESNKSRRMAAQQARRLAAAGWQVLLLDRQGCGDSAGEPDTAHWSAWLADVVMAANWLRARVDGPLWLWGLRAGCLLAAEACAAVTAAGLLYWQPQTSGRLAVQQFLRLRTMADKLAGRTTVEAEALRQSLREGKIIEVAGYGVTSDLIDGLERATLAAPPPGVPVRWLEIGSDGDLPPASQRVVDDWTRAGVDVTAVVVSGPMFWQTAEIEDAPLLWAATDAAMAT